MTTTYDACKHLIKHRSEAPPIDLVRVGKTLDDLWSKVFCSATECRRRVVDLCFQPRLFMRIHPVESVSMRLACRCGRRRCIKLVAAAAHDRRGSSAIKLPRESKVGKHNVSVTADENILGLEVTVDDTGRVQTLDTFDNLGSIESRSITTESTPPCELSCKVTSRMEILHLVSQLSWGLLTSDLP